MDIRNLIQPGRVVCNVEASSRKYALQILGELLSGGSEDLTRSEIFESLVTRERLGCTALGKGVAIPHGRMAGIEGNIGAFVKLSKPVNFDSPDGDPVDLIFAMLVPEDCGNDHLAGLAQITGMFADGDFRNLLRSATSSHSLYDMLVHFEPQRTASA